VTTHTTEIGSDAAAGLASWSCSCGASDVIGFARPTGEPVALRLARIGAEEHAANPPRYVIKEQTPSDLTWAFDFDVIFVVWDTVNDRRVAFGNYKDRALAEARVIRLENKA
jgi:hypothetical protein